MIEHAYRAHQGLLEHVVRSIFPLENISVNTVKEATIKNPTTGQLLELDCWVPALKLGFEFQDAYHYSTTWFSNVTLDSIEQRDRIKHEIAHRLRITLITVPCWWDGSKGSLVAAVLFHRPDLEMTGDIQATNNPISLNASSAYFLIDHVPDVDELMLASFPEMGEFQRSVSSSNSWWMGEKYDGVRFCWNASRHKLYTRSGTQFSLLPAFIRLLPPDNFIDGEVWSGRGGFSSSQKLIYTKDIDWDPLRLIAFDIPTISGSKGGRRFEDRYQMLVDTIAPHHPFIITAPRVLCADRTYISFYMQCVMDDGGEGVILRQPGSLYVHGRSTALVKLKASRGDQEAIVLKLDDNNVELKLPDSRTLTVHMSNVQLSSSLQRGDIVSFSYEKLSKTSLPVDPKIYKIRRDISWTDVIQSSKAQEPNRFSSKLTKLPTKLERHAKNLRTTLEKLARAQGLDPLSPHTWYNISPKEIIAKTQPGTTIFKALQGGYARTIAQLFPDIGIVESEFATALRNWTDIRKRRRLFETYASDHGFNPLVPENWINVTISDPKVATALHFYYGNLSECLLHLFPEIGLDKHMFFPSEYWKDSKNGRKFFENYASKQGFDPLVANHWYSVDHADIEAFQGASDVLKRYRSHRAALMKLFPEIGLERDKLQSKNYGLDERRRVLVEFAKIKGFDPLVPKNWATVTSQALFAYPGPKRVVQRCGSVKNALLTVFKFEDVPTVYQPKYYWRNMATRRKFFESFAAKNGFDPLVASNWYPLNRAAIIKDSDSGGVLNYYSGSISKALMHLFPTIGLDPLEFANSPKNLWESISNVRRWFENFAKQHRAFDPLVAEGWYQVRTDDITAIKGGWAILRKYNGSVSQALVSVFPDIGLDISRFHRGPNSHTDDFKNGRSLFERFATENGFDSLIPANWYHVPDGLVEKVRASGIAKRTASMSRALQHYFPELEWEGYKFKLVQRNYWSEPEHKKQLLESFASTRGFDPLMLENWSSISANDIAKMKGGRDALATYHGDVLKAVTELLDAQWGDNHAHPSVKTRRAFFMKFAKTKGFDPLVPANWYKCSKKAILRTTGARNIIFYHDNSISKALMDLFSDTGLQRDKLKFK